MDEALSDFGDGRGIGFGELLRQIPHLACQRYNRLPAEERAVYRRARTQADMIHACMEHETRQLFGERPDVVLSPPNLQAFSFVVFGRWRFRPHLLNDNLTIQHNTTRMGLEFLRQEESPQIEFGLDDEPTNVILGYLMNSARTGAASVHIVCPKSEEAHFWHYLLLPPDVLPPDGEKQPAPSEGPRPRVRPGEAVEPLRKTGESGA